jgi:hypothetical protein
MASVRSLRYLLWAIAGLGIISALLDIALQEHVFVPLPVIAPDADLVTALIADRAYDTQVYPIIAIGSAISIALFVGIALLGSRLRPYAADGGWSDEIKMSFVVAGALGIASQIINFAVAHEAASGYCDCAYKTQDLISQARALDIGSTIQTWLLVAAVVIAALGIMGAGASIAVGAGWTLLSDVLLLAAVLVAILQLIGADDLAQIVLGLFVLIALPIWAFLLARKLPELTPSTP